MTTLGDAVSDFATAVMPWETDGELWPDATRLAIDIDTRLSQRPYNDTGDEVLEQNSTAN